MLACLCLWVFLLLYCLGLIVLVSLVVLFVSWCGFDVIVLFWCLCLLAGFDFDCFGGLLCIWCEFACSCLICLCLVLLL